jgi:uncharacterized phage infection (PIP) family protein YhgE
LFDRRIIGAQVNPSEKNTMKIIKFMILVASFFAIAGAALFQLIMLLANTIHPQKPYKKLVL